MWGGIGREKGLDRGGEDGGVVGRMEVGREGGGEDGGGGKDGWGWGRMGGGGGWGWGQDGGGCMGGGCMGRMEGVGEDGEVGGRERGGEGDWEIFKHYLSHLHPQFQYVFSFPCF